MLSVSPSSLTTNQSATKRIEPKVSTLGTYKKKKEGIIKATKAHIFFLQMIQVSFSSAPLYNHFHLLCQTELLRVE